MNKKKIIRLFFLIVFVVISFYCCFVGTGYIIQGMQSPKIVGTQTYLFMGNIYLGISYGCIGLISIIALFVTYYIFYRRKKKD